MFPADLGKCKSITVKFGGFCSPELRSLDPIEKINQTTWMINQHELVPDLFRQFGPFISKVSVCFDYRLQPSSVPFSNIVNHARIYSTKSLTSFELMNWQPCIGGLKSLMGLDIHPVNTVRELTIYDSGWSPVMFEQLNRIFPNIQKLKLLNIIFKNHDEVPIERLKNLKELEVQVQLKEKYLQQNIFAILISHPYLEHITLSMGGKLNFWGAMSEKLSKIPSLKLSYVPTTIAGCNGNLIFRNEKVNLVISQSIDQFECKFDRLKELTLSDADYFPMDHTPNNRYLATMWMDFIIDNPSIEKLNVFVSRWFNKGHLTMILKKLPRLTELAILDCGIRMSKIIETLCFSQSIEKLHLINYGGLNDMEGVLEWAIRKDKNNNVSIQKI